MSLSKRYLVFHPAAGTQFFSESVFFFATKLRNQGFAVDLLGCESDFHGYCNNYAAEGIGQFDSAEKKHLACGRCVGQRNLIGKYFDRVWTIKELQGEIDLDRQIAKFKNQSIEDIVIDGLPIGRMAAYEFILANKLADISKISNELRDLFFETYLRNCLKTLSAVKNLASREEYAGVYVYNSCYGAENTAVTYFAQHGKDAFFIHGGRNLEHIYSSFYFSRLTPPFWNIETIRFFRENYESMSFDGSKFRLPLEHFEAVFRAKSIHTYSRQADQNFYQSKLWSKILESSKVVLISLSCGDEFYAADFSVARNYIGSSRAVFADRFEWLNALKSSFREFPKHLFIIRFHPREFPNKRDSVMSPSVQKLESILTDLPSNVHLNYPSEKLSVYNILQHTDLHLCGQSSVGLEGAALGIPTLSYIDGIGNYPISRVVSFRPDRESFFAILSSLLEAKSEPRMESMQRAYEWLLYLHGTAIYNFRAHGLMYPRSLFKRGLKKILREIFGFRYQRISFGYDQRNENKWVNFLKERKEMFMELEEPQDPTISRQFFRLYLNGMRALLLETAAADPTIRTKNRALRNLDLALEHFKDLRK